MTGGKVMVQPNKTNSNSFLEEFILLIWFLTGIYAFDLSLSVEKNMVIVS